MPSERANGAPVRWLQYTLAAFLALAHFHSFTTVIVISASSSLSLVAAQVGPPTNATNLPIGTCRPDIPCANVRVSSSLSVQYGIDTLTPDACRGLVVTATLDFAVLAPISARRFQREATVPPTATRLPSVVLVRRRGTRSVR